MRVEMKKSASYVGPAKLLLDAMIAGNCKHDMEEPNDP